MSQFDPPNQFNEPRMPGYKAPDDFWCVVLLYAAPWLIVSLLGGIAWLLGNGSRVFVEFAGIPEHHNTVYFIVLAVLWFGGWYLWGRWLDRNE